MTPEQCAAIAAYISASICEAHLSRDVGDAQENGWGDMVREAERELQDAAEHTEHCFQALPAELREYLEESVPDPDLPTFPAAPAPMPPGFDVDAWAEMDPTERWEFVYWHYPTLCQDAITCHMVIEHPFQATIRLSES